MAENRLPTKVVTKKIDIAEGETVGLPKGTVHYQVIVTAGTITQNYTTGSNPLPLAGSPFNFPPMGDSFQYYGDTFASAGVGNTGQIVAFVVENAL